MQEASAHCWIPWSKCPSFILPAVWEFAFRCPFNTDGHTAGSPAHKFMVPAAQLNVDSEKCWIPTVLTEKLFRKKNLANFPRMKKHSYLCAKIVFLKSWQYCSTHRNQPVCFRMHSSHVRVISVHFNWSVSWHVCFLSLTRKSFWNDTLIWLIVIKLQPSSACPVTVCIQLPLFKCQRKLPGLSGLEKAFERLWALPGNLMQLLSDKSWDL